MENKPVIDTETGEMLCDGHCGGVCNPQTCDCAENNECDTEPMSTIEQDVEDAVANQKAAAESIHSRFSNQKEKEERRRSQAVLCSWQPSCHHPA